MKDGKGKLWGKINNDEIEIRTLTESNLDEALDILEKSFFLNESICKACEINLPENVQARNELRELSRQTAADGISLVAIHAASGKLVSVAFNKMQFIPDDNEEPFFVEFRKKFAHSAQARRLIDYMFEVDAETDVFALYNIDCLCELMFLSTLPEWERQGIARALAHYTIEWTRQLSQGIGLDAINPALRDKRPRAVAALFTSSFSQKIGRLEGFKVINTLPYSRFSYGGRTFDQRIDPRHKSCEHVVVLF